MELANADELSMLLLPVQGKQVPLSAELVYFVEHMYLTPVSLLKLIRKTGRDIFLSRVRQLVLNGWTEDSMREVELVPYERWKMKLSVLDDLVIWGSRVVIPQKSREKILS